MSGQRFGAECAKKKMPGRCFACCRIQSSLPEERFRALSGFEARTCNDLERPVAAGHGRTTIPSAKRFCSMAEQGFRVAIGCCACRSNDFEPKTRRGGGVVEFCRVRRSPREQRFRAVGGFEARPSDDFKHFQTPNGCGTWPSNEFERKARPVWSFRMLPAWLRLFLVLSRAGHILYPPAPL